MAFIPAAQRNRAADAVCARANSGYIGIFNGTPPADADAALSGNATLAVLNMATTAFQPAVNGTATSNTLTLEVGGARATGIATFLRAHEIGGAVVFQATIGTSGAELNLSTVSITAGGPVAITSLTYTQAKTS